MSEAQIKSSIIGPGEEVQLTLADVAPGSVVMGANGTGPYLVLDAYGGPGLRERSLALLRTGNALCCAPMSFKVIVLNVQLTRQR